MSETAGERIARIVELYEGASRKRDADALGELVAREVDPPKLAVTIKTNCGMFALGVYFAAGVDSPILRRPYLAKGGLAPGANAIAWLRELGNVTGALVKLKNQGKIPPGGLPVGALLRYNTAGTNNDHVEFLLGPVSSSGVARHGGGGRKDNAITIETGVVLDSWGRPLVEYWDPAKLGIDLEKASNYA